MRLCKTCNKLLTQRENESNRDFNRRVYCDSTCLKNHKYEKYVGNKFGKIYVQSHFLKDDVCYLVCLCDCGNTKIYKWSNFKSNPPTHCGCNNGNKTHGMSQTPLYKSWVSMKRRCNNPDELHKKYYKDKGIVVCKEWNDSFELFSNWAMNNGYVDGYTIERIDNDKNYCPENCTWIFSKEQNKNKTNKSHLVINGVVKSFTEWATEYGIRENTIRARMKYGYTGEDLLKPTKKYNKQNPYIRKKR